MRLEQNTLRTLRQLSIFIGALLLGYSLSNIAFAQNSTGTGEASHVGIDSVLALIGSIGIIMGTIGTILVRLPWKWSKDVGKFSMTYGQKVVDMSEDQMHLALAVNAATDGRVETELSKYNKSIDSVTKRFVAANEQLKYLNPEKYIPSNPNEDANMPRENTVTSSQIAAAKSGGLGR